MDFLEMGMKYRNSGSKLQRLVAKCLLWIEKRRADRYEAFLNKTQDAVFQSEEEAEALFRRIREQIANPRPEAMPAQGESEQGHGAAPG